MTKVFALVSFLCLASCGKNSQPGGDQGSRAAPLQSAPRLEGGWLVESISCDGATVNVGPQEKVLSFDVQGYVLRSVIDEKDSEHVCRTLLVYRKAKIVADARSPEADTLSGTYEFFLDARRQACHHLKDSRPVEPAYKDESSAETQSGEHFRAELQFSDDGKTLRLTSMEFPPCSGKKTVVNYRRDH
jgi:hypothetical protein